MEENELIEMKGVINEERVMNMVEKEVLEVKMEEIEIDWKIGILTKWVGKFGNLT